MRMKLFLAFLLSFMMAFSSVNVFAEDEVPATDEVAEVVEATEETSEDETEEVVTSGTTEEVVDAVKTDAAATTYKLEQVEGTRDITVTMSGLEKLISSKKYDEVRVYFKMYYK
ncbi:MAG: hypothetical protein J6P61_06805, partial [Erysipelotrichaceae bacterium]|nr:hypothetical protein [Erysipelotrichaceae bacterium]